MNLIVADRVPSALRRHALERPRPWRDAGIVLITALALRLLFAALTADTYDPDEFVVLALGRAVAHGAVPYRDFTFFHPPGVLMLVGALQPMIARFWPDARLLTLGVDSITAVLVWRIGERLQGPRVGLMAGLLYAASPLALLSAVRIGQDPLITAVGLLGLLVLVSGTSPWRAVVAGVCLGVAIWVKYPAALFLPVYVLAAPRRTWMIVASAAATLSVAFAPFVHQARLVYADTVAWQMGGRAPTNELQKIVSVAVFWLALNPLALIGIVRHRHPLWTRTGFALGGLFVLTSQVYYHYFVPVLPFAALLAAPALLACLERAPRRTLIAGASLLGTWAALIHLSPSQMGLSPAHFSTIAPAVQGLERSTAAGEPVVTDQFEYAYLAHRPLAADYFWNMRLTERASTLERSAARAGAVVSTDYVAPTYPPGFNDYLEDRRYRKEQAGGATIWLSPSRRASGGAPTG